MQKITFILYGILYRPLVNGSEMEKTMSDMENLQLFENQAIRTAWNEVEEEWYFSVVDVVGALTDQPDIRRAA